MFNEGEGKTMADFSTELLKAAHKSSIFNKSALKRSKLCGCFYCLSIFPPKEIKNWIKEEKGEPTAHCPHCYIDSVIPESEEYPLTKEFLTAMYNYWFK